MVPFPPFWKLKCVGSPEIWNKLVVSIKQCQKSIYAKHFFCQFSINNKCHKFHKKNELKIVYLFFCMYVCCWEGEGDTQVFLTQYFFVLTFRSHVLFKHFLYHIIFSKCTFTQSYLVTLYLLFSYTHVYQAFDFSVNIFWEFRESF